MTKKKKKAPHRRTELDRIVKQLRTVLRRRTSDVVKAGNLLIKARKLFANKHGEWLAWLAENFDLSYQTALNYISAAEYVERKSQTIGHFANLSPSVLYRLAKGVFDEREEAAILAEARERRIDEDAMWAIREKLEPADDDDADDAADDQEGGDGGDAEEAPDPEIEAILAAGADPAVPPTADPPPPTDFALQDFDKAIDALNRLKTKLPAQFAKTTHSAEVLESVEAFIHAVMKVLRDALLAARTDS